MTPITDLTIAPDVAVDRSTLGLASWALRDDVMLPADVAHATKRIILDTVACGVGGLSIEPGQVIVRWKQRQGGTPEATLFTGDRLPVGSVANVHAHLANILDADETLFNWAHFASTIVMPALALGEQVGATGAAIIAAIAVGFDVAARVGLSLPDFEEGGAGEATFAEGRGYSWAAFGTAATAARLLRLTVDELMQAWGLVMAMTPVHGLLGRAVSIEPLPWHKYAMYGTIAEAGVNAVQLAQSGFLADPAVLDADSDFYKSFCAKSWDIDTVFTDLGTRWYIAETSIKPYPFCRFSHGAIDLFSQIVRHNSIKPDEVESVVLTIPPFAMLRFLTTRGPGDDVLEAYISMKHAFWMLLNGIRPGPQWFAPEAMAGADRQEFGAKVTSRTNNDWSEGFVHQVAGNGKFRSVPIGVRVRARGQTWELETVHAKGDPWTDDPRFAMTDVELEAKVRAFCANALDQECIETLRSAAMDLDRAPDVSALTSAFQVQSR